MESSSDIIRSLEFIYISLGFVFVKSKLCIFRTISIFRFIMVATIRYSVPFSKVPFIILLVRQVFDRLRKHAFFAPKIDALERRAHLKGRLVRKYRLLGLMLFVAIPLPGTGAWTGALIAAFLNIRLRHALPAITLGLLIAGSLVTLMTLGLIHLL